MNKKEYIQEAVNKIKNTEHIFYTRKKCMIRNNPTLAMAEIINSGMGSMLSPMPRLRISYQGLLAYVQPFFYESVIPPTHFMYLSLVSK